MQRSSVSGIPGGTAFRSAPRIRTSLVKRSSELVRHSAFCLSMVSYRPVASAENTRTGLPTTVPIPGTGSFGIDFQVSLHFEILKCFLNYHPWNCQMMAIRNSADSMVRGIRLVPEGYSADEYPGSADGVVVALVWDDCHIAQLCRNVPASGRGCSTF